MHLTWAVIDLKALAHNYTQLVKLAGQNMTASATPMIMPVIKADAYGHGVLDVAKTLNSQCSFFGVSNVDEGIMLRRNGFKQKILLFESTLPSDAQEIVAHELTPTVCTKDFAAALNKEALARDKKISIHIKVDTGQGFLI